jgi:hypothetical protein
MAPKDPPGFIPDPPGFIPDEPDSPFAEETGDSGDSVLKKAWNWANKPLLTAPAEHGARKAQEWANKDTSDDYWTGFFKGLGYGSYQGLGEVASSFTSPLSAALTLSGARTAQTAKQLHRGYKALQETGKTVEEMSKAMAGVAKSGQRATIATKALSAPQIIHGVGTIFDPENPASVFDIADPLFSGNFDRYTPDLAKKYMAIPEIAGGILGMQNWMPEVGNYAPKPKTEAQLVAEGLLRLEERRNIDRVIDNTVKKNARDSIEPLIQQLDEALRNEYIQRATTLPKTKQLPADAGPSVSAPLGLLPENATPPGDMIPSSIAPRFLAGNKGIADTTLPYNLARQEGALNPQPDPFLAVNQGIRPDLPTNHEIFQIGPGQFIDLTTGKRFDYAGNPITEPRVQKQVNTPEMQVMAQMALIKRGFNPEVAARIAGVTPEPPAPINLQPPKPLIKPTGELTFEGQIGLEGVIRDEIPRPVTSTEIPAPPITTVGPKFVNPKRPVRTPPIEDIQKMGGDIPDSRISEILQETDLESLALDIRVLKENLDAEWELPNPRTAQRTQKVLEAAIQRFKELTEPQEMKATTVGTSGLPNIAMGGATTRVLDVLGSSLYSGDPPVIATKELIQNASDEHRFIGTNAPIKIIRALETDHPTIVGRKAPSMTVRDYGRGLTYEQLAHEFTNVGETGKAGSTTASGGFGFAKASPILGGDYVRITSIVDEADGIRYKYTVEGNPKEWKDQVVGVNVQKTRVSPDTPTGLEVTTFYPEHTSLYQAKDMIENIAGYSTNISNIESVVSYDRQIDGDLRTWLDDPNDPGFSLSKYTYNSLTNNMPERGVITTPGAEIKIYFNDNPGREIGDYTTRILNKGLFQKTTHDSYGISLPNAPDEIVVDVRSLVEEGHKDYPFTANREQLNHTTTTKIIEWVQDNIVKDALINKTNKIQRSYDEMSIIHSHPEGEVSFVDQGARFTPDEILELQTNPIFVNITRKILNVNQLLSNVAENLPWAKKPSTKLKKFGILFASPDANKSATFGIHIPNPSASGQESAILINLFELLKVAQKDPYPTDRIATGLFATQTHELAHVPGGGHDTSFAYRHADLLDKLGRQQTNVILDMLVKPFGDIKSGQFNPEVQKLLRIYENSRKRPASTDDPLLGTGVAYDGQSNFTQGEGQNPKGARNSGVGPEDTVKTTSGNNQPESTRRKIYELARGMTAAGDISAPFRQGLALIGTREWTKAWKPMFEAFGNETAYLAHKNALMEIENVKNGLAKDAGLELTDLISQREEILKSSLAEQIPMFGKMVRASNRAYTAYLNDLRANTFNRLVKDAQNMGIDLKANPLYARQLAEFVNDATGRAKYKFQYGKNKTTQTLDLERHAPLFSDVFFSGRLMASRIRMLNPGTYMFLPPQIRQQYLKSLIAIGSFWLGSMALAKMGGAEVSTNPTNSDFGKIKVGNNRLDVAGGFQQYLVLAARFASGGYTPSTTNELKTMGEGFKAKTREELLYDFGTSKLHPTLKLGFDLLAASEYKPFHIADRIAQAYIPMVLGDLAQIYRDDPSALPLGMASAVGMGAQTYEKGQQQPVFFPEEDPIGSWTGGQFMPEEVIDLQEFIHQ